MNNALFLLACVIIVSEVDRKKLKSAKFFPVLLFFSKIPNYKDFFRDLEKKFYVYTMNTTLTRSNAVFAFTLSNLAFLTAFLVLSTMTKVIMIFFLLLIISN